MTNNYHVAVVILNYNTSNLLEKYIPYVLQTVYENFELIIVDNASTDGSAKMMKEKFPSIRLIELKENYGYAGGYNKALKEIDAPFWVLLNSDIEVHPHWLSPMMDMMKQDAKIGAVQPKILDMMNRNTFEYAGASGGFMDKYGYAFCRGRLFDDCEEDQGQYDERRKVFWASGAALLVRASAYKEAGGLDEDFFAHMEEIDLCWRMQHLNYSSWVCPEAKVWHIGGGTLKAYHPQKTYLNFRNNLVLMMKNLPSNQVFSRIFFRMVLDAPAAIKMLTSKGFGHFWAVIRAHWSFLSTLSKWRKKRNTTIKIKNIEQLDGVLNSSIVYEFFIKKKKTFKILENSKFIQNSST